MLSFVASGGRVGAVRRADAHLSSWRAWARAGEIWGDTAIGLWRAAEIERLCNASHGSGTKAKRLRVARSLVPGRAAGIPAPRPRVTLAAPSGRLGRRRRSWPWSDRPRARLRSLRGGRRILGPAPCVVTSPPGTVLEPLRARLDRDCSCAQLARPRTPESPGSASPQGPRSACPRPVSARTRAPRDS